MKRSSFFTVCSDSLSALSPAEQAIYVRLSLMAENGKGRGWYEHIAKFANVSLSTFKRVVKSLSACGLVEVVWRQKTPSMFLLDEKTRERSQIPTEALRPVQPRRPRTLLVCQTVDSTRGDESTVEKAR